MMLLGLMWVAAAIVFLAAMVFKGAQLIADAIAAGRKV